MTYDCMAINHKQQFGRAKFTSRSWNFFLLALYSQKNFEFYQSFSLYPAENGIKTSIYHLQDRLDRNKDEKQMERVSQPSMKLTEFIMVLIVILVLIVIEYSTVKYIRVINHLCQG